MSHRPALTRATLSLQSDERLVALSRSGSEAAFAAIFERYRRPLLRHCARVLDSAAAEDVVQQTFLKLYLHLRDDYRSLALKPWLYRVTHNLALNAVMKKGGDHEPLSEELDGVPQPPQLAALRARFRDTVDAVGALPERQRVALVRHELEGRSCEQIAAELETSPPAIRQLLARARTALRDGLGGLVPFPLVLRAAGGGPGAGLLAAGDGPLVTVAATKVTVTVLAVGAATGVVGALPLGGDERLGATAAPAELRAPREGVRLASVAERALAEQRSAPRGGRAAPASERVPATDVGGDPMPPGFDPHTESDEAEPASDEPGRDDAPGEDASAEEPGADEPMAEDAAEEADDPPNEVEPLLDPEGPADAQEGSGSDSGGPEREPETAEPIETAVPMADGWAEAGR